MGNLKQRVNELERAGVGRRAPGADEPFQRAVVALLQALQPGGPSELAALRDRLDSGAATAEDRALLASLPDWREGPEQLVRLAARVHDAV